MILNTDGGARGNPGPGALGIVIKDTSNTVTFTEGKYLGVCTNNEAEYNGIIFGLTTVLNNFSNGSDKALSCVLDSELVVKQLKGEYKVKNDRIQQLHTQAKKVETELKQKGFTITYTHTERKNNKQADTIVNEVLDNVSRIQKS
jgi:ribonuclease HI